MEQRELAHVVAAILVLFISASLSFIIAGNLTKTTEIFIFSFIILAVHVFAKKGAAYLLDANAEHRIWHVYHWGIKPRQHFKKEVPFGILVPLLFSVFTLGIFKFFPILTYETRALKRRAARRFGFYSYTAMTDIHNSLIGAAGIIALLLLAMISYLSGYELLTKLSVYYTLANILPVSNLDGTQILFGNKIIWVVLAFISAVFALFGFLIF